MLELQNKGFKFIQVQRNISMENLLTSRGVLRDIGWGNAEVVKMDLYWKSRKLIFSLSEVALGLRNSHNY